MKTSTKIVLAVLSGIVVALGLLMTLPSAGKWLYQNAAPAEASLYGFHTESIKAGDVTFKAYRGGMATAQAPREAVVLIHGYSADRQVWPRFAKHLVDRYEVIIPDLAGHGDTGFVPGLDYSGPAQARRVIAMLDSLGIQKAHFMGNSMGGFISGHLALAYPERTLSITVMDPAGVTSPEPSDMGKMLAQGKNPFETRSAEDFKVFYAMTMAKPPFLPPSVLAAVAEDYQRRRPELAEIFTWINNRDALDAELGRIQTPTLVLWGDQDRLIHVSAAPVWTKGIAGAQMHIFKDIGHMPMVEVPEQTAEVVNAFLAGLAKK